MKERIAKMFEVKVGDEDLKREAKMLAAQQFAQYGMTTCLTNMLRSMRKIS